MPSGLSETLASNARVVPQLDETQGGLDTLGGWLRNLPGKFQREAPLFLAGLKALAENPTRIAQTPTAQAIKSGVTLPRDVYEGKIDPRSDEGIARTQDMANFATGGSFTATAPAGSLAAGAARRAPPEMALRRDYMGPAKRTPVEEWEYGLGNTSPNLAPVKDFDVNQLRIGDVYFPLFGDRSRVSAPLVSLQGEKLPAHVTAEGGPDFMRTRDDRVWASGSNVTTALQNKIDRAVGKDGRVFGVYSAMGPQSIDYSHHAWEPVLWQAPNAPMTAEAKQGFDAYMRQVAPAWPGLDNPERAIQMLHEQPNLRTPFMSRVVSKEGQASGLPEIGPIRWAMTEPDLRGVPTGSTGYSVAEMRPGVRPLKDTSPFHTSYATEMEGRYAGRTGAQLPWQAWWPDYAARPDIAALEGRTSNQLGKLRFDTPVQTVNQQLIDDLGRRIESEKRGR